MDENRINLLVFFLEIGCEAYYLGFAVMDLIDLSLQIIIFKYFITNLLLQTVYFLLEFFNVQYFLL